MTRIGVFFTSAGVKDDLEHCFKSIALNTVWPDFEVFVVMDPLAGADPLTDWMAEQKRQYPWLNYEYTAALESAGVQQHRGCQANALNHAYRCLLEGGCTRFFHLNDDVSVTRYWLHYAESALRKHGPDCVVIPHDGISQQKPGTFSNFHYFSSEYVYKYGPVVDRGGLPMPYYPGDQCYWIDTEFVVRAAHHGRLVYEPRCCVLHLHYTRMPDTLNHPRRRRQTGANADRDALIFAEHMRREGINPWRYLDVGRWQGKAGAALEALKSIK